MKNRYTCSLLLAGLLTVPMQAQFLPGALAAWSFNNGNAHDDISAHDGTVNFATLTQDRFGNAGNAYAFSGNQANIMVPYAPLFTMADSSFSISLWFKALNDTSVAGMDLLSWYRCGADPGCNGADAALYMITMTGGHLGCWVRDDAAQAALISSSPISYDDGLWHHTVMVVDQALDQTTLYVDEQVVSTVAQALGTLSDAGLQVPLSIGRRYRNGWAQPGLFFKGSLDDISIYRRPLTVAEVAQLHTTTDPNVGVNDLAKLEATVRYDAECARLRITTPLPLIDGLVQVTDLQGRLVATAPVTGTTTAVPTDAWTKGCYLVSVRTGTGAAMGSKVVVY